MASERGVPGPSRPSAPEGSSQPPTPDLSDGESSGGESGGEGLPSQQTVILEDVHEEGGDMEDVELGSEYYAESDEWESESASEGGSGESEGGEIVSHQQLEEEDARIEREGMESRQEITNQLINAGWTPEQIEQYWAQVSDYFRGRAERRYG